MASTENTTSHEESPHDVAAHQAMYKGMMDFGMTAGLPIGGAIATFVAFILMSAGVLPSLFISFLTWLGLLIISKTFFVH